MFEVFRKLFQKKVNCEIVEERKEIVSVEMFIKPWLYNFIFTFSDKNHPYYSSRDCYKEATGRCLLEQENYKQKKGPVEVYDSCVGLKKYLQGNPDNPYTLPFISSWDGKTFYVSDGQHRLCVASREKIKIYVHAEIPREKLEEMQIENESEIHICTY